MAYIDFCPELREKHNPNPNSAKKSLQKPNHRRKEEIFQSKLTAAIVGLVVHGQLIHSIKTKTNKTEHFLPYTHLPPNSNMLLETSSSSDHPERHRKIPQQKVVVKSVPFVFYTKRKSWRRGFGEWSERN